MMHQHSYAPVCEFDVLYGRHHHQWHSPDVTMMIVFGFLIPDYRVRLRVWVQAVPVLPWPRVRQQPVWNRLLLTVTVSGHPMMTRPVCRPVWSGQWRLYPVCAHDGSGQYHCPSYVFASLSLLAANAATSGLGYRHPLYETAVMMTHVIRPWSHPRHHEHVFGNGMVSPFLVWLSVGVVGSVVQH